MTNPAATDVIPSSNNTVSDSQTTSNANSSAVQVSHHATGAAARVLNTPELLDLILSKLWLRDLLLKAPLTCRGFKMSIDSSPTINKRLEFAVIDLVSPRSGYGKSRHLYLGFVKVRNKSGVTLIFGERSIERCLSSPSFRKLRSPNTRFSYGYMKADHPTSFRFVDLKKPSSSQKREPVLIAELLETIVPKGTVQFVQWRAERSTT